MSAATKQERPRNHLKEVNKKKIARIVRAPMNIGKYCEKYFVKRDDVVKNLMDK